MTLEGNILKNKGNLNTYETTEDPEEENIVYNHIQTPEVDCKYSKNGFCEECILIENEKCPYKGG